MQRVELHTWPTETIFYTYNLFMQCIILHHGFHKLHLQPTIQVIKKRWWVSREETNKKINPNISQGRITWGRYSKNTLKSMIRVIFHFILSLNIMLPNIAYTYKHVHIIVLHWTVFWGTYCLHLQGPLTACLTYSLIRKEEAMHSSVTLVNFYHTMWHYTPDSSILATTAVMTTNPT
jgi:hypothetical protein